MAGLLVQITTGSAQQLLRSPAQAETGEAEAEQREGAGFSTADSRVKFAHHALTCEIDPERPTLSEKAGHAHGATSVGGRKDGRPSQRSQQEAIERSSVPIYAAGIDGEPRVADIDRDWANPLQLLAYSTPAPTVASRYYNRMWTCPGSRSRRSHRCLAIRRWRPVDHPAN